MTDTEISRRLALAIGWSEAGPEDPDMAVFGLLAGRIFKDYCAVRLDGQWRAFDCRDPAVIWPIAERFAMFPRFDSYAERWYVETDDFKGEDTAAKAVALAVINSKGT